MAQSTRPLAHFYWKILALVLLGGGGMGLSSSLLANEQVPPPAVTGKVPVVQPAVVEPPAAPVLVAKPVKIPNPFPRRVDIPEIPRGLGWINTRPLSKADLKGKFVLFDFWTYCCINCMHILPELKKLEHQYPNELVVIGVHSAKFDTEKDEANILEAVLRYEIQHAVVNDADHKIWDLFGINSWPTVLLVDPEGKAIWGRSGEFKAEEVANQINKAILYYGDKQVLTKEPFKLELAADTQKQTPLRFPGKIMADEVGQRLFISDSNHNRIVVTDPEGKLIQTIGSGREGRADGDFAKAEFNHPQGCALVGDVLYVADTENHLLRKVHLKTKVVGTVAGIGRQAENAWPGIEDVKPGKAPPTRWVGKPKRTGLNSPWDLWVHEKNLYIAMAGPHQIWKMPLDESEIGPFAGNGREDIVDGPLLPRQPYEQGFSSFAQPSGLTSDGNYLYVADSEGSSIRAVPFDPAGEVFTVVGSSQLPSGRLFAFGDLDGPREKAKLQHCLAVAFHENTLFVADTCNSKIKKIDAKTGAVRTIAGTGKHGKDDEAGTFDEPAGLAVGFGKLFVADTNNHVIRTIDLMTGKLATLMIAGLDPPAKAPTDKDKKPSFKNALKQSSEPLPRKATEGVVTAHVKLELPAGWKINPMAPMAYYLDSPQEKGIIDRTTFGKIKIPKPTLEFDVPLMVKEAGTDAFDISFNYYYCEEGDEGVCKVGSVVLSVALQVTADGDAAPIQIVHKVPEN